MSAALAGSFELVELHSLKTEEEGSLLTVTIPRDMAAKIISRMGELLKSDAGALAALDRAYANMVFAMAGGDGASKPSETLRAMADRLAADQGSAVTGDAEIRAKMSGGRFDRLDITFELYGEAFEFSYLDGAENESGESYIYLGGDIPSFGEFLLYFGALTLEDDNIAHTLNIEFYDDRGGATMLQLLTNTAPGKDGATKTGAQLMAYLGKKSISCNMALSGNARGRKADNAGAGDYGYYRNRRRRGDSGGGQSFVFVRIRRKPGVFPGFAHRRRNRLFGFHIQ